MDSNPNTQSLNSVRRISGGCLMEASPYFWPLLGEWFRALLFPVFGLLFLAVDNKRHSTTLNKETESIEQTEMNPSTTIDVRSSPRCGNSGGSDIRYSTHSNTRHELNNSSPSTGRSSSLSRPTFLNAPEKKITLFALRLVIIEKIAYGLGKLAFIWASVVLLGGYASALKPIDFWLVTGILIVEGARTLSRGLQFEWQYQTTHPILDTPSRPVPDYMMVFEGQQTWLPKDVHLLPHSVFVSVIINFLLRWQQILNADACAALSLMRLGQQDFGEETQNNQKSVLIVFYILALAEALMFLLEKCYWTWTIEHGELFTQVIEELDLDPIGMVSLRLFFYDAHSKCIGGSILDGLNMDLISFAEKLLDANSLNDQMIGAKILQHFVKNEGFAVDTLCKIGSSARVVRRLIEMLNGKHPEEKYILLSASQIVAKLTLQYVQLVVTIPGAVESLASLLQKGEETMEAENYLMLLSNGLSILKHLAKDLVGCQMIQNKQKLLARIIELTSYDEALLRNEHPPELPIKVVRRALKVVKNLVSATGETGRALRRDISESDYLMRNIEKLLELEPGESTRKIQILGLGILSHLGVNENFKKKIWKRHRMLWLIFELFFRTEEVGAVYNEAEDEDGAVYNKAGDALAVLVLHMYSYVNMLYAREDGLIKLVVALDDPVLSVYATRILRGLLAYYSPGRFDESWLKISESNKLQRVAEKMPMILRRIIEERENEKLLEASIGLALQILKSNNVNVDADVIEKVGNDIVKKLVEILKKYDNPNSSNVPEMRIFVIELATTLMNYDDKYVNLFIQLEMEQILIREGLDVFSFEAPEPGSDEAEIELWNVTKNCLMKLMKLESAPI